MIPIFPDFINISLEDKNEIETYTLRYNPYSDYNFISMFIWDVKEERKVSKLNGNLIIRFTDYETGEHFLSFLGDNDVVNTINKLINFAKESSISTTLRFITEEAIVKLKKSDFQIHEDRNNADYIYSVSQIAELKGSRFKKKRYSAEKFLRENQSIDFKFQKFNDVLINEDIIDFFNRWKNSIKKNNTYSSIENEERAVRRLLKHIKYNNLYVSSIYLKNKMIGFSIDEIVLNDYAVSHFLKADNSINGIHEFFNKKISEHLIINGINLWNWEQDLGIENLRKAKMGYNPVLFLKKYSVSLINI